MKPIKIFVDCHKFDEDLQGITTYLKGIYVEMTFKKNIVFYFVSYYPEKLKTVFGEKENIHYLKYTSKNKYYRLIFDAPRLIKLYNIDYAHFQYVIPPFKFCKYIITIHDVLFLDFPEYFPLPYRLINKFLFRFGAKNSNFILTVSDYSKERIEKHFEVKDVVVTPNAVNSVFFDEYDKEKAVQEVYQKFGFQNYWLFTSRWEPRKNHELVLKAFVEGSFYQDYNLVFIGKKAILNKKFKELFDDLSPNIKNKIYILENIDDYNMLNLLRAARLFIYPSFAEGFGIPPIEAIASKIPTICSNTTAMSDFVFIKDGFFNPYDINDFYKILENFNYNTLEDKKAQLKKQYHWNKSASILESLITK
ncbi:glycosyltransferase family 4 protein [Flavobacterium branchiophilum]|uniref:Glycosyl transferase n=1 Tax=Flavobacterium branchiophilum TaxID=55197 RepID=A0A2H3KA59_9FLAO|nr:glycosyltransferase family 1 protein [Flavobacterium branchiophilum]PDS23412.1 glycosyl transferase [Flavobacterium branchiophilum]